MQQWLTLWPREICHKAQNPQSKHHVRQSTSLVWGLSLPMLMATCDLVSFFITVILTECRFILWSPGRRGEACLSSCSHLWEGSVFSLQLPYLKPFSALKNQTWIQNPSIWLYLCSHFCFFRTESFWGSPSMVTRLSLFPLWQCPCWLDSSIDDIWQCMGTDTHSRDSRLHIPLWERLVRFPQNDIEERNLWRELLLSVSWDWTRLYLLHLAHYVPWGFIKSPHKQVTDQSGL